MQDEARPHSTHPVYIVRVGAAFAFELAVPVDGDVLAESGFFEVGECRWREIDVS